MQAIKIKDDQVRQSGEDLICIDTEGKQHRVLEFFKVWHLVGLTYDDKNMYLKLEKHDEVPTTRN